MVALPLVMNLLFYRLVSLFGYGYILLIKYTLVHLKASITYSQMSQNIHPGDNST